MAAHDPDVSPLFRMEAIVAARSGFQGERTRLVPLGLQAIAGSVAGLIVAVGLGASQIDVSRKTLVTGVVTPVEGEIVVQAARHGVLESVRVREGQWVAAQEVLARISSATDFVGGRKVSDEIAAATQMQLNDLDEQIRSVDRARQSAARSAATRVEYLHSQIALTLEVGRVQTQRHRFAEQRFDRIGAVRERNVLSGFAYAELRDGVLAKAQGVAETKLRQGALEDEMSEVELNARRHEAEFDAELAGLRGRMQQLRSQRLREGATRSYQLIAPRAGVVTALMEGDGDAVALGQPILKIVPLEHKLKARLSVPGGAIAGVEVGTSVLLRLDAYPFQKYGGVSGAVEFLSQSTAPRPARSTAGGDPVYLVDVRLTEQQLTHLDRALPLRAGMGLSAELVTDRRSLAAWLAEPILARY